MRSDVADPRPAGCGFTSSARSVKTLAQGSTSFGGWREVVPSRPMNKGGDKRLGVGMKCR